MSYHAYLWVQISKGLKKSSNLEKTNDKAKFYKQFIFKHVNKLKSTVSVHEI